MIDSYQRYATGLFVLSFVCLFVHLFSHTCNNGHAIHCKAWFDSSLDFFL